MYTYLSIQNISGTLEILVPYRKRELETDKEMIFFRDTNGTIIDSWDNSEWIYKLLKLQAEQWEDMPEVFKDRAIEKDIKLLWKECKRFKLFKKYRGDGMCELFIPKK